MNSFGSIFKVTSFGESHSAMVGCVVEGVPAGLVLDLEKIQLAVDKRKTNQTNFSSTRNEEDVVEIVSGVFEQKTLGSPICILIKNKDARSQDYDALKQVYRPSHADYTYEQKFGFRDHRGGGRSSFRITAPLVAAGEIAHQFIQHHFSIEVIAYVSQIGTVAIPENESFHWSDIEKNEFRCPYAATALKMQALVEETRVAGDTLGGIISCQIKNMPVGIGEPIFGKLNAQLAQAMMSINTVKGFEFGDGFANAALKGSESNDLFECVDDKMKTKTNHSGGIQGGISNGEDVFFRVAFKPISSIQQPQETLNQAHEKQTININGRHDVCAVPRAVPVVTAYANIVLADLLLHSKIKKS
jgi:chorismate synthase